jgi:capsular polysaccharide export protein
VQQFARPAGPLLAGSGEADLDEVIALMVSERIGGNYWGVQPHVPAPGHTLIAVKDSLARARLLSELAFDKRSYFAEDTQNCDPWHLIDGAAEVIVDADDELAVVAAIAGLPVRCVGEGRYSFVNTATELKDGLAQHVLGFVYANPFSEEPMTARQAVQLSAFWRTLIDRNRVISAAFGIAAWKRETVEPLMWGGEGAPGFPSSTKRISKVHEVAVWRSRTSPTAIGDLERHGARLIEIEDGFIRSSGLGADCIPPLSIVVDRLGIYFDASRPSDLERLLEEGSFPADLIERATKLRAVIVNRGISKYAAGPAPTAARRSAKHSILVPGQVEDDRAVLEGGMGLTSNLELLRRVRARAPGAHIVYKPHPDVEAGHRRGAIDDGECLSIADEVVREGSISQLIEAVDEVHVNTSLAGFEALLRLKPVTTYGAPFYAGWGLTTDHGPVPKRRTARRSLDELVAAALILYPRYLDPNTGLPCPPEILFERLADGISMRGSPGLTWLRRLQGRLRRKLAKVANG